MGKYLFYADQLIFILVTYISVKEEIYATWAYREYAPANTIQSKLFHRWGAANIFIFMIVCAMAFSTSIINAIILSAINGFIYWLLFDIWYAKGIKQKWYYLGGESSSDNWLKKYLGKNAGKNKAYLCILIIVLLNLFFVIFKN